MYILEYEQQFDKNRRKTSFFSDMKLFENYMKHTKKYLVFHKLYLFGLNIFAQMSQINIQYAREHVKSKLSILEDASPKAPPPSSPLKKCS